MLLGKKTKYTLDSEWALVLDRLPNEFSKGKVIDKLAEVFSLSHVEAKDLIENTPIILLDHIPFELAGKIKDFFTQANVECFITNDTFTKRKCFRAVWPEPPDLNRFLGKFASAPSVNAPESTPIEVKDHTVHTEPASLTPPSPEKFSGTSSVDMEPPAMIADEKGALKELTLELQKENELLKFELEKIEGSVREREKKRFDEEIEKLRAERARSEEIMVRLRGENIVLTNKIEELERRIKLVKQTAEIEAGQVAKLQIDDLRAQAERLRADYIRAQNAIRMAQSEGKQFQTELSQVQKALLDARDEIEDLKRMLNQAQANAVHLKEEVDRMRLEAEDQFQTQNAELEEWKRKANDWSTGYFKAVKENEFLRAHQSEELESLRARNQQLNVQLEQAQRQIKDFVTKLEQQDLIQKRMKTASELAESEAHLKALVQKQQTLEMEIREREEEIKNVLTEQQAVEQDIVKVKQAQKYLLEQAKLKDKSRFIRPAKGIGSGETVRPDQESMESSSDD